MASLTWGRARQSALECQPSAEHEDFDSILEVTRAMEESQRLLRKWDRMWFGIPRQRRADGEAMERYEWMYGRSMGNRDELLQRLRASQPMPGVEYHADMARSASTGLLSNPGSRTPEATLHGRLSNGFGGSSGELQGEFQNLIMRKESSNSWRFRIWPSAAAGGSFDGTTHSVGLQSENSLDEPDPDTHPPSPRTTLVAREVCAPGKRAVFHRTGTGTTSTSSGLLSLSIRASDGHGPGASDHCCARASDKRCDANGLPTPFREAPSTTAVLTDALVDAAHAGPRDRVQAPLLLPQPPHPERRANPGPVFKVIRAVASEERTRHQRDAWIWGFTRRWVAERNRAGVEEDEECRAFKAVLAGEDHEFAISRTLKDRRMSSTNLSGTETLSECLLFPAESSTSAAGLATRPTHAAASEHLLVR